MCARLMRHPVYGSIQDISEFVHYIKFNFDICEYIILVADNRCSQILIITLQQKSENYFEYSSFWKDETN